MARSSTKPLDRGSTCQRPGTEPVFVIAAGMKVAEELKTVRSIVLPSTPLWYQVIKPLSNMSATWSYRFDATRKFARVLLAENPPLVVTNVKLSDPLAPNERETWPGALPAPENR